MNVDVRRAAGELTFLFEADPADAGVPLSSVWFRLNGADRIGSLRVSLMAYLLARPFIGNSFTLTGLSIPAHLAARLHQDFDAHEFFVGPVDNIPERILPDFNYATLEFNAPAGSEVSGGESAPVVASRHELGYTVEEPDGSALLNITTNADLFAAFVDRPVLVSRAVIYLCAFDVLGVERLRVRDFERESRWLSRLDLLLSEVGGGVDFEKAVA